MASRRNPHPWQNVAGSSREAAISRIAGELRDSGYTGPHAAIVIAHWNNTNQPPATGREIADLVQAAYQFEPDYTEPQPVYLGLIAGRDRAESTRRWLLPGFLPAGQRIALLGRWSLGKSFLALHSALCIATGSPFLGDQPPEEMGNVVILDGEGGSRRALSRLAALHQGPDQSQTSAYEVFWREAHALQLSSSHGLDDLRRQLRPLQPKLVIFDTLAKVMGLNDENSNTLAAQMTAGLCLLSQELDASILSVAHPIKSGLGSSTVRGAGELSADPDVLWTITKLRSGIRSVRCIKDRDGDVENHEIAFTIHSSADKSSTTLRRILGPKRDLKEIIKASILSTLHGCESIPTIHLHAQAVEACSGPDPQASFYRVLSALAKDGSIVRIGRGAWSLAQQPQPLSPGSD